MQELKQQHIDLQTVQKSTEEEVRIIKGEVRIVKGELRQERHANHKRYWIVFLLLMTIGGILHAYMYLHSYLNVELSSKIENISAMLTTQSCPYICL